MNRQWIIDLWVNGLLNVSTATNQETLDTLYSALYHVGSSFRVLAGILPSVPLWTVLAGMQWYTCLVCLHDILLGSDSRQMLEGQVQVFAWLCGANLKLNNLKVTFSVKGLPIGAHCVCILAWLLTANLWRTLRPWPSPGSMYSPRNTLCIQLYQFWVWGFPEHVQGFGDQNNLQQPFLTTVRWPGGGGQCQPAEDASHYNWDWDLMMPCVEPGNKA